ncbi:Hypothetical predicted protein [Pelobates cultripes]|uniref:Uncharacterized protein n=1 Tax=Pelobates cultripes TaxID=61616 RepID=A0AAD1W293_PELCU|nr:Hypothetical predicted protein [Pelobates cultripes]
MGRTKRSDSHQTTKGTQGAPQTGPLDGYLRSPGRQPRATSGHKMADDHAPSLPPDTLEPSLSATLHEAIRSEVATFQRDIAAQVGHIQNLEATHLTSVSRLDATDAAVARQGNMLLQLRRQTENLDNRSHRSNIRIRNLPESAGEEDVTATLTALFRDILGPDSPQRIDFDRAHRALRPRTTDNAPRDIICCLHEYKVKELIMNKARTKPTWRFQGAEAWAYPTQRSLTGSWAHWNRGLTNQLRELQGGAEKTRRTGNQHPDTKTQHSPETNTFHNR